MNPKYIMLSMLTLSLILGGCSNSGKSHSEKSGTEVSLLSGKKSGSSSAKSDTEKKAASSKEDDDTVKTQTMEDADTSALTSDQCIAWGTAAYAVQHHLSFADTTDLSAKITNKNGYGYITMFKGKKQVACYQITADGCLKDMKTKKIISRKPIQIVLTKSKHKKHQDNMNDFNKDSSSSSESSGSSTFNIGGRKDEVDEDTPFSSQHQANQEQLAVMAAQALYNKDTIPDPPEKGREPGSANSRITIRNYGNGQIFLCTSSSADKDSGVVCDFNYTVAVSDNTIRIHQIAAALSQDQILDGSLFDNFDDDSGAILKNTFTADQLYQKYGNQRRQVDAWLKVMKTQY